MTGPQQQEPAYQQEAKEPVVFSIVRSSKCSECGDDLYPGNFLTMEKGKPLCLECADLDHLVYLPRGDTALTRRARKHSSLSVVVVRFSRTRKRYERQGVLVEEAALRQAEEQCAADVDVREVRRAVQQERRVEQDQDLQVRASEAIRALFPNCPADEARQIAAHTMQRGSGRVGRTASGRALDEAALTAAAIAAIRHRHTNYDELLMEGVERFDARHAIRHQVDQILAKWRAS